MGFCMHTPLYTYMVYTDVFIIEFQYTAGLCWWFISLSSDLSFLETVRYIYICIYTYDIYIYAYMHTMRVYIICICCNIHWHQLVQKPLTRARDSESYKSQSTSEGRSCCGGMSMSCSTSGCRESYGCQSTSEGRSGCH